MRDKELAKINQKKYLYPPTWEQIESFVNGELGIKMEHFERFYNLPYHYMTQVKRGDKLFPKYAWHIIFEKIKPTYGSGFLEDYNKKQIEQPINKPTSTKMPTKVNHPEINQDHDLHDRISTLK